jgi:spermidine synthase
MKVQRHQLFGVLLTSMGALALEVVLTRIFSVTMWYHFAFMAISLALMGSAAAGVMLYFFPKLTRPENARRVIGWIGTALAVLVPLTFALYLKIPFRPVLMNRSNWLNGEQMIWLILIYLDLGIPFFLSGMILSLALSGWSNTAGRIYWADLTGASLGCLFSVVVLDSLGGANALLAVGVLLALASVTFNRAWRPRRAQQWIAIAAVVALTGVLVTNVSAPWLTITVNKAGGVEPDPVYEHWNAQSRVTVYDVQHYPFFWAISPENWERTLTESTTFSHALLLIDAVAGTPIQEFNGDLSQIEFLRYDLTSFAYHMIDSPKTLVIGPGGGRDVLAALATGAPHVTAVEVNPAVINAVRNQFADFSGHLYSRPDVEVEIADARGYIDRSAERYDVIQASLIDTWAAGGSGAFALSENSLYTREAFQTYYEHLSDRGILTVSRWYLPQRPAETMRLVATGMAGWAAGGVSDPRQHVAVIKSSTSGTPTEGLSTVLFKRQPFTAEELATLNQTAEALGYEVIYTPGCQVRETVGEFITSDDHQAYIEAYPLDISPATDDRPFFFNLILLGDLIDPDLSASGVYRTSMEAIVVLFGVIGVSLFLAVTIILLPLIIGSRQERLTRPSAALLGYFSALGVAFMLVEIPTIQKLTVYLGRPVYSLVIVLFSLLLSSGIGSLVSSRWPEDKLIPRLRIALAALVAVILLHTVLATPVLRATLRLPLATRLPVAIALLAVLGFLMGIPFPVGIRWAGRHRGGTVPWLWGMNGVMSVLGSAMATALSIHVGFRLTIFVSAVIYALALALISREARTTAAVASS